jgi:hypothetical protein
MPFLEVKCGRDVTTQKGYQLALDLFTIPPFPISFAIWAIVGAVGLSWWAGKKPSSWRLGLGLFASVHLLGLMALYPDIVIESFKPNWSAGHNKDWLYGFYWFLIFTLAGTAVAWREYKRLHEGYAGWKVLRLVLLITLLLVCVWAYYLRDIFCLIASQGNI